MEPNTPPTSPDNTNKQLTWPLVVNLSLLVLSVVLDGGKLSSLPFTVIGLAVINGLAAFILHLAGKRMHYVVAFLLSCLVLLLIGGGLCALLIASS